MKSFESLLIQAKKDNITCFTVAGIILNKEKKMLLCQRALYKKIAPGIWHIPGGKIEIGETITEAIKRELFEELHVEVIQIQSFSGVIYDYKVDQEIHRTAFILVQANGKITLNRENNDYKFITLEELARYVEPKDLIRGQKIMQYALKKNLLSDVS